MNFLVYRTDNDVITLAIMHVPQPTVSAGWINEVYEQLMLIFASLTTNKASWDKSNPPMINQAANTIARNSRRGVGNVMCEDYLLYHGKHETDRIAHIIQQDGLYHIYVNPSADRMIEKLE